ncbi:MAG: hypothetical protein WBG57_08715 [Ornithinimicrobium sp.]
MKSSLAAAAALAVLVVAGCAGEGTVTEAPEVEGAPATTSEPAETEEPTQDPSTQSQARTEEPTEAETELAEQFEEVGAQTDAASFGDTVAWDDGISLSVSEPEPYEPTESAAGNEGFDEAVKFTVTVTNDTDEEVSLLFLFATVTSGGSEGSQVFDYGGGLEFAFDDVPPGEQTEVEQAHAVNDADDVVVNISPDLFYDEVEFS